MAPCSLPDSDRSARCGTFRVLEGGDERRVLDLRLVVVPASDASARRDDPVVVLPGGPGDGFVDVAHFLVQLYEPLNHDRDLVFIDPRGTGRSGSLSCAIDMPGGEAARFDDIFPPAFVAACRDHLEVGADLTRYTSHTVVEDLERLRAWLGYPSLNLLGISYGTRVAQRYAVTHPDRTRTMILNGVVPVGQATYLWMSRNLDEALAALAGDCRAAPACIDTYPGFPGNVATLGHELRASAQTVELADGTRVSFGYGAFAYALRGLLYARGQDVPLMMSRAVEGDLSALAGFYRERVDWLTNGYAFGLHLSTVCAEDVAGVTDADVARATDGTLLGPALIDAYRRACSAWPRGDAGPATDADAIAAPTLLLSGSRDPATPTRWARAVAADMSDGFLVEVPGGGHVVWSECIGRLAERLIATGATASLDASCVEEQPRAPFTLPERTGSLDRAR